MDDDWDESPSVNTYNDHNQEPVDTGRNFSRGRGFTKAKLSNPGNETDEWGGNNDRQWGGNRREGGGARKNPESVFGTFDDNGNDDEHEWVDDGGGDRRGKGSWESRRGGNRGGRSGGFRKNENGGSDDWGNGDSENKSGFGGGRPKGGRFRSGDDWGSGGGDNNDENGDRVGGRGRGGRGGRGGGRGGFRRSEENGGNSWGDDNNDDDWGASDNSNRGRGSGRGRGGRGGGRGRGGGGGGDDDGAAKTEKPRTVYVPPEPTDDENEMFGTSISSGINFDKYDNIPVKVTGDDIPPKCNSFEEAGLRPILLTNIKKSGYSKPTPIQKIAIPMILAGRDVMACAQTGSGKTAAFLLPIINKLIEEKVELIADGNKCEPQVVIVSPTRELAIQIRAEARKFAHDSIVKTVVTYGGVQVHYQLKQTERGCHILVATPGRMNDFVIRKKISFASVRYVVLDEADRMLDMGFLPAIEQMMNHESMVPTGERQTLMFSATFPEEIQMLAARFLSNYLFITIGIIGGACSDVQQVFYQVDRYSKRQKLLTLLTEEGCERTLVFVETKRNADFIATYLSENNVRTTSIHGDRLQNEREEALRDFKNGFRDVLVATDVAARGLDIKNVKHVINYDLPKSVDEYVHRIGRTGRVGNRGKATSFFDIDTDRSLAPNLLRILNQANQIVPDWLESAAAGGGGGSYNSRGFGGRDVREDTFGEAKDFNAGATEEPEEVW